MIILAVGWSEHWAQIQPFAGKLKAEKIPQSDDVSPRMTFALRWSSFHINRLKKLKVSFQWLSGTRPNHPNEIWKRRFISTVWPAEQRSSTNWICACVARKWHLVQAVACRIYGSLWEGLLKWSYFKSFPCNPSFLFLNLVFFRPNVKSHIRITFNWLNELNKETTVWLTNSNAITLVSYEQRN